MAISRLRRLLLLLLLILTGVLLFLMSRSDVRKSTHNMVKHFVSGPREHLKGTWQDTSNVVPKKSLEREPQSRAGQEAMEMSKEKPKPSLLDSLLVELQESFKQIAAHSQEPKVRESDMKCQFKDTALHRHGCPPGVRSGCIQQNMSTDLRHRLEDCMHNDYLQIAPQYREVLNDLEKQIEGHYRLVAVSALSSNHYLESQAMLKDLHENIFPLVPNMTLVVYDLGMTAEEHEEYQKLCRCKLIRFPFEKLPTFCRTLNCFCWKPFVVRAHLANGDMVMWMDASIRYIRPERFLKTLERTELYGLQQNHLAIQPRIPVHAMPIMFHHFGFTPCAFKDYHNAASNWAMYRNTPLIQHAVLDVWVACGLNQTCTCPIPYKKCPVVSDVNRHRVGHCQRPQTSVSLIIARLWMEDYNTMTPIQDSFTLKRGNKRNYFGELEKRLNGTGINKS